MGRTRDSDVYAHYTAIEKGDLKVSTRRDMMQHSTVRTHG